MFAPHRFIMFVIAATLALSVYGTTAHAQDGTTPPDEPAAPATDPDSTDSTDPAAPTTGDDPGETLTETPTETPAETPTETPRESPDESPDETTGETPESQPTAEPEAAGDTGESDARLAKRVIEITSRREQSEFEAPRATRMFDSSDIRQRYAAPDFPSLLEEVPGVTVQRTGRYMGSPFIRGFTAYSTLVLIDGIRYNNSAWRSGPNQYWGLLDSLNAERIEMQYGPASVLYGSDAIGGSINIITRRWEAPTDAELASGEFAPGIENRLYLRYGTAEKAMIGNYTATMTFDPNAGMVVGITGRAVGDLRSGDGTKPYTGYDQVDVHAKYSQLLSPDWRLDVTYQFDYLDDGKRTHSTIFAVPFNGSTVGSDIRRQFDHKRHLGAVHLTHSNGTGFYREMKIAVSYQYLFEDQFRVRSNGRSEHQGFHVHTLGSFVQFSSEFDTHELTYGLDVYADRARTYRIDFNADGSFRSVGVQGPFGDDAWYITAGLFAQDKWTLSDSVVLNLGVRGQLNSADADQVQDQSATPGAPLDVSRTFAGFAGNIGVQYFFCDEAHMYLDLSTAFRAPTLHDLTSLESSRTDFFEIPSPNLDPEYYYTAELGSKMEFDMVRAQIAVFATLMDNRIVRIPTGNLVGGETEVAKVNASTGWAFGFELGARVRIVEGFYIFGDLSWMDGETTVDNNGTKTTEPLSRMPPFGGQIGLRWEICTDDDGEPTFWVEVLNRFADSQTQLSSGDMSDTQRIPPGGTPGWNIWIVRGGWNPSPGQTIFIQFENIFDRNYRLHGSGLNEPGFNFIVGLEWNF